ncbi:V-type ATPase subunit [Candidatus Latescibacterota bacterium]
MIQVPAIEYVNVRIKSYRSQLLTRDIYEDLLGSDNLGALTTFLLEKPLYRQDIEHALEGSSEREGLERGVKDHFVQCISNIFHMSHGKTRRLFEIALTSFDLRNLRALILAHIRKLPFHRAREMFIPCGLLTEDTLSDMLAASDIEEMLQLLSLACPYGADAVRKALNERTENESLVKLINRLERNVYRHILKNLDNADDDTLILRTLYLFEIDLKNIKTALKYVSEGVKPGQQILEDFIPGGNIGIQFFDEMSRSSGLDEALEMIESTQFSKAVEKGIIYFAETGFFHEMERFFEEVFILKAWSYRRHDPFGIGIFVGYVWSQFVELTNLRTIINGIAFRTGAGQIRKGLIYV